MHFAVFSKKPFFYNRKIKVPGHWPGHPTGLALNPGHFHFSFFFFGNQIFIFPKPKLFFKKEKC
jgi:hypothetical protein